MGSTDSTYGKNANAYKLFLVKMQCDFITWNTQASLEAQINGVSQKSGMCMYVCVCMYVYMYVCMYVCMYIYMYVCIYVYIYVYMYMYVCMYIYICIHICMYISYIGNRKIHVVLNFRIGVDECCRGKRQLFALRYESFILLPRLKKKLDYFRR